MDLKKLKHRTRTSGRWILFTSQLPTFTPKNTLIRIIFSGLIGWLFLTLATKLTSTPTAHFSVYLKVILIFIVLAESNVLFDKIAERRLPIPQKIRQRLLIHLCISVILGGLAIAYFAHLNLIENILKQRVVWLLITLGLLFTIGIILFTIGVRITEKWISAVKEVEQLKQVKLNSKYSSLQDQLNPHFLFNNLSVLKSMISYDPQAAIEFVQNFTDVYRYVLQNSQKDTIKLADEIELINAYIGLQKERLGDGLDVDINVDPNLLSREIPPLALQLLFENAIKHNVASKKMPLHIQIFSSDETVTLRNNIQIKDSTYSTKKGLNNLKMRYEILSNKQVIVDQTDEYYSVTIPLL